jgi:hypothetical protein
MKKVLFLISLVKKTISLKTQIHGLVYIINKNNALFFWASFFLIVLRYIIAYSGRFKNILTMIEYILFGKFIIDGFLLISPSPVQVEINNYIHRQVEINNYIHRQVEVNQLTFDLFAKQNQLNTQQECIICYDQLNMNDNVFKCTQCKNCYHEKCFTQWVEINQSCPNCRKNPFLI